jgi:hypothetical protein
VPGYVVLIQKVRVSLNPHVAAVSDGLPSLTFTEWLLQR